MNLALTWVEGKCVSNTRGLEAWAASLHKHSPDTRIVVLSPEPVKVDHAENVVMKAPGGKPLHRRWCAYSEFLCRAGAPPAEFVVLSDARDLVFQADPFAIADSKSLIVVSEQQKTGEHPWCRKKAEALEKLIGARQDLSRIEINGGIQLGPLDAIRYFAQAMESFMFTGADTDQAIINWWFRERCSVPWKFAPEGWYIHGEAVALGKQKMALKDGLACVANCDGPATVWHQYDRTGHAPLVQGAIVKDASMVFVVAHYNEPLHWLGEFPYQSFVVSKNGSTPPGAVQRPNVGYEAETWAWFFAEHYDDLPKVMICLQGKPFDHIKPDVFQFLLKRVQMQGDNFTYAPVSTPGHKGWTGLDTPDHHGIPMKEWWPRLFKSPPPLSWYAPYGGQFIVHRNAVRQRPREYWQMIRDNCKTRNDACTLERLWQFILMGLP